MNPEWRARAEGEVGGDRVSNTATGIWIDKVAKIGGSAGVMGLRAHLEAALAQSADVVQVVLNDLPRRDCMLGGFDGDFGPGELSRYEREFVDPIAAIESDPRYGSLRIVNVLDVDAIPSLVVGVRNTSTYAWICQGEQSNGDYVEGIRDELNALHPFSNVYTYLDMAHHGLIGWDSDRTPATQLLLQTVQGTTAGLASIDGVTTNMANYGALREPFFTIDTLVNGSGVYQSKWVDWNPFIDELPFAQALRTTLVSLGFDAGIGVLIDTSRDGWGGPARPTQASTSLDVNTFVDRSRIDRRGHVGPAARGGGSRRHGG